MGIIKGDTEVIYYYKLKDVTLTVHHYKEGTTEKIGDDVIETKKIGSNYQTNELSNIPEGYELVRTPSNASGILNSDVVVIYYYKLKDVNLTVHHYIEGTTTSLVPDEVTMKKYGEEYTTSAASDIPQNYILKTVPEDYKGTINSPNKEVIYYYQKKDSNIVPEIKKEGTGKITSNSQTINYQIEYKADFTDLIGQGTVTIVDNLPYKIDESRSNLNGGVYNEANKTITWTENVDVNSYNEKTKIYTKNVEIMYKDIDVKKDTIVNKVSGKINIDGKEITTENTYNTLIEITGKIIVKYIDKDNGNPIIADIITEEKVGNSYTSREAEIEGYKLVTKPTVENYEYQETDQTATYIYEKIKLQVETKIKTSGGNIEGNEEVLYGEDSTKDKIKIKADTEYIIDKVWIDGEEVEIPKDLTVLTLSNFPKMNSNKLVEVSFKEKTVIVKVPKTNANIPAYILIAAFILIIVSGIGTYVSTGGSLAKIKSIFKK